MPKQSRFGYVVDFRHQFWCVRARKTAQQLRTLSEPFRRLADWLITE
jgi:hypothetical protein